jgi:hypothetical protein
MTTLEQAARQALDLCVRIRDGREVWGQHELRAVCETLRAALAQQQAEPVAVQLEPFVEEASNSVLVLSGEKWVREGRAISTAVQAEPASLRPKQHDYASFVGYTRALEAYCDGLEQAEPVNRIEVIRRALDALEWHYQQGHSNTLGGFRLKIDQKILRDLKATLSQQAEPAQAEPVADSGYGDGYGDSYRSGDGTVGSGRGRR